MTEKKKQLIDAICEQYGFDYPETDEEYNDILDSYNFTSWCYSNHERMSLATFVKIADRAWLLDDDEY